MHPLEAGLFLFLLTLIRSPLYQAAMEISYKDAHRKYALHAYNIMIKPVGPVCNLNCTYCYYLEKKNLYREAESFRMNEEVLESFIRQYIQSQTVPTISFVWQGGEPTLLGLDFFEKVLELQEKYAGNKQIINSLQTNGTRLDERWARFLAHNNFLTGISIDGPQHLHDHYRTDKKGNGSFREVIRGIQLLKEHGAEFNTLTVVNNHNVHYPKEIYAFLRSIGSRFMQFIPIVEQQADPSEGAPLELISPDYSGKAHVTDWSVSSRDYGKFLTGIFDEWVVRDVGRYFVQIFDTTLANWVSHDPGLCVFDTTCGEAAVLEHNGDLYSCDHFVYHENYLGNILQTPIQQLMKSEKQIQFGLKKETSLPETCHKCRFLRVCRGGCPKNRIHTPAETNKRINHLCEGYQHFFSHVAPYMNFMTEELAHKRPPANVMQWARYRFAK